MIDAGLRDGRRPVRSPVLVRTGKNLEKEMEGFLEIASFRLAILFFRSIDFGSTIPVSSYNSLHVRIKESPFGQIVDFFKSILTH